MDNGNLRKSLTPDTSREAVGVVTTRSIVEFARAQIRVRRVHETRAQPRLGWSLGWLVGYFVRCGSRECLDLAWPDLRNFAPYPYLPTYLPIYLPQPPSPSSYRPPHPDPLSPLVTMLPFPSGRQPVCTPRENPPSSRTYAAWNVERCSYWLILSPPFVILSVLQSPPCSACLTMLL